MNLVEVKKLRAAMEEAMVTIGETFGMSIRVKAISYGDDDFRCKIEGLSKGAESLDARCYRQRAEFEGLPPLGSRILLQDKEFTITGWKKRASKYPILVESSEGTYKISLKQLQSAEFLV